MLVISKKRVAWLSVASNALLTVGKLVAGVLTGSVSIISEAAHSAIDLIAAGIATFSVHYADLPPDHEHPYGHEKIENVSGVIEGLLILAAAGWIVYESAHKLIEGVELQSLGAGAVVMAISAGVNLVVATLLKRTADAERSVALEADAAHLYTDVYTSAGVFGGLTAIMIGERFFGVRLSWLDPVAAMLVALIIVRTGYQITVKSFWPLMDSAADAEEEAAIMARIAEFEARGVDFHKLRTRRAGATLHVDLHMGCRPGVTLERGHAMSHELKARIEQTVAGATALIHVEPSRQAEELAETDERYQCMRDELSADERVCAVRALCATNYRGELRVVAELGIAPEVTLTESHSLTEDLRARMRSCFPEIGDLVVSIFPDDGWRGDIAEPDQTRIRELLGEHESLFASVQELKVSSSGGRRRVQIRVAVPRLLPVADAHEIAVHVEDDVRELFPDDAEVDVRIEPCEQECDACSADCPEKTSSAVGVIDDRD